MIHENRQRDKYGRTVYMFEDTDHWFEERRRATVVVTVLPRQAAGPNGERHMVTDWQVPPGPDKKYPQYKGLAAARAAALALLSEYAERVGDTVKSG